MIDPDVPYTEAEIEAYKNALRWVIGEVDLTPDDQDKLWKVIDG